MNHYISDLKIKHHVINQVNIWLSYNCVLRINSLSHSFDIRIVEISFEDWKSSLSFKSRKYEHHSEIVWAWQLMFEVINIVIACSKFIHWANYLIKLLRMNLNNTLWFDVYKFRTWASQTHLHNWRWDLKSRYFQINPFASKRQSNN